MLTPDGRLVILDFGQVVEVPPGAQYAMLEAVAHAWQGTSTCHSFIRSTSIKKRSSVVFTRSTRSGIGGAR